MAEFQSDEKVKKNLVFYKRPRFTEPLDLQGIEVILYHFLSYLFMNIGMSPFRVRYETVASKANRDQFL